MYRLITAEDRVRVSPQMLIMDREEAVKKVLKEKYEGKINKDVGLILEITKAKPKASGLVFPGDPYIYHEVEFEAIAFTLEVNEVFRGIVREVMDFGAFVSIGPFEGLLHISQIGKERFSYDKKSKVLSSSDKKKSVKKGDELIVKVSTASLKPSPQDTKIGLTMRAEGLGSEAWIEAEKKKEKTKKKEEKKEEKEGKK
ncbi:MAG: DNA-directed RNA polymerase [Candidatus Anstonellales archaeon]